MKHTGSDFPIRKEIKRRNTASMEQVQGSRFVRFFRGKRTEVDMTEGSIFRHVLQFALPLLLGNVFQQLYNMVDTWVVGNFVGDNAFSAVGTVAPIVNLLIGFFMGLSSGAGVVISQYYGAKQYDKVKQAVHTALLMTLALCVVFTVVGVCMTPLMVRLLGSPADTVAPEQRQYLSIYFAGIAGLLLYNIGSAILRAIGNSRLPFVFLVLSALLNMGLDLLFVLAFGMGVEGVAYATILSQAISAVLVLWLLFRTKSCVRVELKALRIDWQTLWKIIRVGIPAALQMSITAFSNIFVMNYITRFGADVMGGWTAYSKIDLLALLPMQSVSLASTTFVGQNLGRGLVERSKKGVRVSLALAMCSTVLLIIPIVIFAPYVVRIFNQNPEIVRYGTLFLRYISPFYVLCCFNQVYAGALRGAGNSRAPMIIMLASFVVFRQIYLYIMWNFVSPTVLPIAMGYPAGWLVCSVAVFIYYRCTSFSKYRLVEDLPKETV